MAIPATAGVRDADPLEIGELQRGGVMSFDGNERPTAPRSTSPTGRPHGHRDEQSRGPTAIVLVGGKGTRLRPLTDTTPKPMLPVMGRPLLSYTYAQLRAANIRNVILACGYLPTEIEAHFGTEANGVAVEYRVEPEPLGTAGAIRFAASDLRETFLALNGDTLRDADLRPLVAFHRRRGGRATMLLGRAADPSRYGVVDVDGRGRVRGFREKPAPEEIDIDVVNTGVYVLEPDVLDLVPPGRPVSIERDVFPSLAAEGSLYALELDGYWIDVGTPEAYLEAHMNLLEQQGGVVVDQSARVSTAARVVAPAAIGADAVVGDGASVGPFAFVGEGASVGESAIVEHAVILPRARLDAREAARTAIVAETCVLHV